ncbi:oligosaccharide flippase family protein [Ruegeria sp. R14_0]|uniref:oligosaccharide flippase family protein n=1 Tax=Ruegeria sp. R14_0 TaxID=2821100 RepID=UPI001ADA6817|nr:oligosaccharide flippase family protein [Ruegeria sp. R14_0]MBO9445921.1 oligosaccharide flippase family protein [Ruegeria sp. R14_0]
MTWYFAPRMLSAVIAVLILIVLTRVLGPADFGRYNLTLLLGNLLFSFTFHWLAIAVGRFHHAKEFQGRTIASTLGAGAILAVALFVLASLLTLLLPGSWVDGFFYAAIYCISHAMHELGTACLRQYHEGPKYAAVTLLRHILGVALAVVLVLNGGGYKSALIGMSLGAALPGAYALMVALRRSGIGLPDLTALKTYLWFGFPLAVVSSGSTFFAMSTQSLLALLAGMEFAGYFAAAQSLATRTLRLPMSTLSRVVGPSVFQAQEEEGTQSSNAVLNRYFSFLMLISLPIVAALICSAGVFSNLLFDPAFADQTAGYLRVMALASFTLGLQGAYFSFSFSRSKKTALQLGITFCSLVVHVILSFGIIYLFGASGASVAFLISAIFSFGAFYLIGRKVDPVSIPSGEIPKAVAGFLAFAPFGIWANSALGLPAQFSLLALGGGAMFVTLVGLRQIAAVVVWQKGKRLLALN